MSKNSIIKLAGKISHELNYDPGKDLLEIIKKFGGEVIPPCSFEVDVINPSKFFLSYFSPTRFQLAHEFGHYVLHSVFGKKPLRINIGNSGIFEWEANWFAAGFLIPDHILQNYPNCNNNKLAWIFKVPVAAVNLRSNLNV